MQLHLHVPMKGTKGQELPQGDTPVCVAHSDSQPKTSFPRLLWIYQHHHLQLGGLSLISSHQEEVSEEINVFLKTAFIL